MAAYPTLPSASRHSGFEHLMPNPKNNRGKFENLARLGSVLSKATSIKFILCDQHGAHEWISRLMLGQKTELPDELLEQLPFWPALKYQDMPVVCFPLPWRVPSIAGSTLHYVPGWLVWKCSFVFVESFSSQTWLHNKKFLSSVQVILRCIMLYLSLSIFIFVYFYHISMFHRLLLTRDLPSTADPCRSSSHSKIGGWAVAVGASHLLLRCLVARLFRWAWVGNVAASIRGDGHHERPSGQSDVACPISCGMICWASKDFIGFLVSEFGIVWPSLALMHESLASNLKHFQLPLQNFAKGVSLRLTQGSIHFICVQIWAPRNLPFLGVCKERLCFHSSKHMLWALCFTGMLLENGGVRLQWPDPCWN